MLTIFEAVQKSHWSAIYKETLVENPKGLRFILTEFDNSLAEISTLTGGQSISLVIIKPPCY